MRSLDLQEKTAIMDLQCGGGENCVDGNRKIAILGNSTSDATFTYCKSWGEYFYERLQKDGIRASVWCGAMLRVNSGQELWKLIRDVIPQKPDLVINVSGVCNIEANYEKELLEGHFYIWNYQKEFLEEKMKRKKIRMGQKKKQRIRGISFGLEDKRSWAEWWVEDMRLMHAICAEFGITFRAVLQPNLYAGDYKATGLEHTAKDREYPKRVKGWYEQVKQLIADKPYIWDFTTIYDGMENIYWDTCHVYEKGNRIMAKKVCQFLQEEKIWEALKKEPGNTSWEKR